MPNPILSTLELPVKDQSTGEVSLVSYNLPASGSSITIDDEIDPTSHNPVENMAISAALDEKADTEDLGTAAFRDVPTSGNANVTQVVVGSDTRLTNARPASDVYDWAKAETKPTYTAAEVGAIPTTDKGANNGIAELDENGKVPSSQLPSYVDDVLEYDSVDDLPLTGETGKIYVVLDTNKTYRWSGSAYVVISPSLALGETSSTAYRGDRGKAAYDHSQTTSGNPHNVTKSDVGLGNVGNFKAVSTEASQGLTDTEKSNARTNIGAGTSSLTLGTSSTTAYRGDRGNLAYAHAVTNKGAAFASGLYKITTNSEGHVTAATAVEKADITGLGIPGSDTNTHRPIQVNGTQVLGDNTTALNLKAGSNVSLSNSSGTVTIAATNTNDAVSQTATTTSADYEVLFSSTADNTTRTEGARKNSNLKFNPSTGNLQATQLNGVAIGSSPKFTDTNTKVTSVGNHYTPAEDTSAALSADASSSTAATWGSTDLVTGVNIQRDAKGHVVGVTVDSIQMPANPNSNTIPSAYCSTAAATAAKVASCSGYALLSKSFLHVIITTANTSQTALTLNVNSKGAKPIYINGSASSTSNYTLPAGSYLVYYNGTNYYFRTDGKLTASITGDAATVNGKTVAVNVPSGAVFTDTRDFKIGTTKAGAANDTLYFVYTT